MVATGPEGDDAEAGGAHRDHYRDASGSVGAASIFGTPPSILGALRDEGSDTDDDDDRFWIIDEVCRVGKGRVYGVLSTIPQARHLLDTFGGRAVRTWYRCHCDNDCRDDSCIHFFVDDGIRHYGEWAEPIASILCSVASMADDEAVEDTLPATQQELASCDSQ